MKRILGLLILLAGGLLPLRAQYQPDILGEGYSYRTIQMPDDREGPVVCTLVKKEGRPDAQGAILYLHGYNDYFFQWALGDSARAWGYNFYALDLRKYGRSLRPHQDPFSCDDLGEYFADIDTALAIIRSEGNTRIWLMGHSTGGLTASYYLLKHLPPYPVRGLILNSPFLDWNFGWGMENILLPSVSFLGRFFPDVTAQDGGAFSQYAASLLKRYKGEWLFNTDWKLVYSHPKKAGWVHAIHTAQLAIQNHPNLLCPILVLSSSQSVPEGLEWDERYRHADIVLDVDDIQTYGRQLGPDVTCVTIPDGLHDLLLSAPPAREQAYRTIRLWLEARATLPAQGK